MTRHQKYEVVMRLDETYYIVMLERSKTPRLHERLWPALHEMARMRAKGNGLYRLYRDSTGAAVLIQVAYIDGEGDLRSTGQKLDLEEKIMFRGWQELRPLGEESPCPTT